MSPDFPSGELCSSHSEHTPETGEIEMRKLLILALAIFIGLAQMGFASTINNDQEAPVTLTNIIENANGFQVEINFPSGELRMENDELGDQLKLALPGCVTYSTQEGKALPAITRMVSVRPGYTAVAKIVRQADVDYDVEPVLPRDDNRRRIREIVESPELQMIEVGDPIWIRWLRVVPVVIRPARYDAENHSIAMAENLVLEIEFVPDDKPCGPAPDPERYWSQAFEDYFQEILLNPGGLPRTIPGGRMVQRGTYLILTNEVLGGYVAPLVEWKERKGFDVVVHPIYYDGISTEEIKDYVQEAYDTWDRPPEFVLIVGDVNAPNMRFPAYRVQNPGRNDEWDVTDLPYVLLEGDDYYPDAFIGRISTDSPSSTVTRNVIQRIIDHEQQSYRPDEDSRFFDRYVSWFNNATLFAGNFSDGGNPIISPVETTVWLGDHLRRLGWDVEEFYYRGQQGDTRDAGPIIESLNNRHPNIFAYRGWADANGPHYPQFHIPDLVELDNGPLLPVWTFFVCNTGDFGNNNVNPCFGEAVIALGDRNRPIGALSFFGPSDLHTKTIFNNPLIAGYYTALLYKHQRVLGPLTLFSKNELWAGFPDLRGPDNYVEFYFHVYNILGDPEVNLFLNAPDLLEVNHPAEFSIGDSNIPVVVRSNGNPVVNALVNVQFDDETNVSVLTDLNGVANVPVQISAEGEIDITVIGYQKVPYLTTVNIVAPEMMVGFAGVEVSNEFGDDRMVVGTPVEFTVTLQNFGQNAANGVTATLSSEMNSVTVESADASFGDIAAGGTAVSDNPFRIIIEPRVWSWIPFPFYLTIEDGSGNSWTAQFRLTTVSGVLYYQGSAFANGIIEPGETDDFVINVRNGGPLGVVELRAELYSFDNSVEMIDGEANFPALATGGTGSNEDNPFQIRVMPETVTGRHVAMRAFFYDSEDRLIDHLFFNITVGDPGEDDPLGPDGYGYYAYEDIDNERYGDVVPEFNWIELVGNGGALHRLDDDNVRVMDLPFTFTYYGLDYDRISICSNGWFSFGETWMENFRNWGIPSPLGPPALVAPLWEDLVGEMQDNNERDSLNIYTRYDEEQGRFIIQWNETLARSGQGDFTETFEAILYDPAMHETVTGDGEIVFQYLDFTNVNRNEWNYVTVGFEDYNHFRGLELTYSNRYPATIAEIESGRAIKITTNPPDPFLGVDNKSGVTPVVFALDEPYPNPFNSSTSVNFSLSQTGKDKLGLWDLNGRFVREIVSGEFASGYHSFTFDAGNLASGLYLLKLESAGNTSQRKLTLLR